MSAMLSTWVENSTTVPSATAVAIDAFISDCKCFEFLKPPAVGTQERK